MSYVTAESVTKLYTIINTCRAGFHGLLQNLDLCPELSYAGLSIASFANTILNLNKNKTEKKIPPL